MDDLVNDMLPTKTIKICVLGCRMIMCQMKYYYLYSSMPHAKFNVWQFSMISITETPGEEVYFFSLLFQVGNTISMDNVINNLWFHPTWVRLSSNN